MLTSALRRAAARSASRLPCHWAAPTCRALSTAPASPAKPCLALHISEIGDERLFMLAKLEGSAQISAARERMRREIMRADNCCYESTTEKLLEINKVNSSNLGMQTVPYHLMWAVSVGSGVLSIPLVFSKEVGLIFNKYCVTMEVPGGEDLETVLEVGSWTWNWMEPPLGTLSFVLLCFQFGREARNNLGAMTPAMRHKKSLADKLAVNFPMYTADIVKDYAEATAFDDDADDIQEDIKEWKLAQEAKSK